MKELIEIPIISKLRDVARVLGYHNKFTVEGLKYDVLPASVGITPLGPPAALYAIERIKEKKLNNLKILDIGCGVGIIGLTIFKKFLGTNIISEVALSDINFFNLISIEKTLKKNNYEQYLNDKIKIYLSDVLKHMPKTEKYNLILSNPPDFKVKSYTEKITSGNSLGRYSPNYHFHKTFYSECHNFLEDDGEIWFIENQQAIPKEIGKEIIDSNKNIKLIETFDHKGYKDIYWTISKKVKGN